MVYGAFSRGTAGNTSSTFYGGAVGGEVCMGVGRGQKEMERKNKRRQMMGKRYREDVVTRNLLASNAYSETLGSVQVHIPQSIGRVQFSLW